MACQISQTYIPILRRMFITPNIFRSSVIFRQQLTQLPFGPNVMFRTTVIFRSKLSFGQSYYGSVRVILRSTLLWFGQQASFDNNYVSSSKYLSIHISYGISVTFITQLVTETETLIIYSRHHH